MKVIVACEESQAVTAALLERGHDAWSMDLQETSGPHPERHLVGDVIHHLQEVDRQWDMVIAHPPCTYLANSGVRWLSTVAGFNQKRMAKMEQGARFFRFFTRLHTRAFDPIPRVAIENPIIHRYAKAEIGRGHDQLIQPWMFGHPESKATCLWLYGLPHLQETNNVKAEYQALPKSQGQRMWSMPPGPERQKLRSKTYEGIAKAMASQWSAR